MTKTTYTLTRHACKIDNGCVTITYDAPRDKRITVPDVPSFECLEQIIQEFGGETECQYVEIRPEGRKPRGFDQRYPRGGVYINR